MQELLRACGRAHDLADVHRAIEALHEAQPPSWSIDLIGGLPGLTRRSWERSVRAAVQSGAPHVSVYDLQVSCRACLVLTGTMPRLPFASRDVVRVTSPQRHSCQVAFQRTASYAASMLILHADMSHGGSTHARINNAGGRVCARTSRLSGMTQGSSHCSSRCVSHHSSACNASAAAQVEEGTPFGRWHEQGKLTLPDDSDSASMLAAASARLRAAGYQRYELSNYAQPGHECRHNLAYWRGHGYYAFGLGAASFVRRRRFSRPRQLARYYAYVDAICEAACGHDASRVAQDYIAGESEGEPALSDYDLMLESVMLQLRLHGGINLPRFARAFGQLRLQQLLAGMQPHLQHGRAELLSFQQHGSISGGTQEAVRHVSHVKDAESVMAAEKAVHLALTDPEGLMMSNDIISDAFVTLEEERTAHECDALG